MELFQFFLSVVYLVRNQDHQLDTIIHSASEKLSSLVTDYELIIVYNAFCDELSNVLKNLTGQLGYPNLQVYALTKEVDGDTTSWVELENELGDFVADIDSPLDDISFLQHPQPAVTYRYLTVTGSFAHVNMEYSAKPIVTNTKKLRKSIDRGMRHWAEPQNFASRAEWSQFFGAVKLIDS